MWIHWGLVGAAPVMLLFGELPGFHQRHGLVSSFLRVGLVCIPVAVALVLVFTGIDSDDESDGSETHIEMMYSGR